MVPHWYNLPMMFLLSLLLLAAPYAATAAEKSTEKRVGELETRVTKVERRLTRLESWGKAPGTSPKAVKGEEKPPEDPIAVLFLAKKQVLGEKRAGIRLYMRFTNLTNQRFFAFNGTLVFRNEKGSRIWEKPYGHSEMLGPGEAVDVSMGLLSNQAKTYLKFVKARTVTVTLEKQEVYGLE